MNLILDILTWIANNIFGVPAFLIGIIVSMGLLLQKSSLSKVISGTLKAIMGFLIINIGAGVIVGTLNIFQPMWAEIFGLSSTSMPSAFMGFDVFNGKFGGAIAIIMSLGFSVNVILARITKFKYIYLTGHMMFWTIAIFLGIIINVNPNANMLIVIPVLSLLMGVYWTLQPALTQKYMRMITGNDSIALGHTVGFGAWLSAVCGKLIAGKNPKSAEDIKISDKFSFLRDSNVITALTMGALFIIGAFLLINNNSEVANTLITTSGTQNFVIYCIIKSIEFAAGIAVVLYGVRLFIGELVPAFKGISTKLVPGAIPAFDCPTVFPYSPNSVIFGFLGAFIGGIVWMFILGNSVGYVFVPTMIVLFFHGATAGVFGNVTGGYKGAIFGGIIIATIVAVGQYITVMFLVSGTIPDTASWAADTDMFILGPLLYFFAKVVF
ncbi:MAG: PTS ascorbate transporter subunit IIC [Breznakia sp.]